MYKIVIDCFGGDRSPQANVQGAIEAFNEKSNFSLILTGKRELIEAELNKYEFDKTRVEIVDADEVITCEEQPTEAIKVKPNSSMMKGFASLKDCADAFVSLGSTGALLVGSVLKIGRIKGVSRPALAPVFPTVKGGNVLFLDAGANADCKPVNLFHFALMGSVYAREAMKIENPRVALLSNGTEEAKGNELTKSVYQALKNCEQINFVGNIEAREILSGDCDVVVTDGFSGNVALKSMEGVAGAVFAKLKEEINASLKAKIGYLFLKKSLKKVKDLLDYNKKGGAVFLGAKKIIIKAHGASKSSAVKAAVLQAVNALECNVTELIEKGVNEAGAPVFPENAAEGANA